MDTSPFGLLSPEIRNRIYYLAFTAPHTIQEGKPFEASLTRVCRQIRAESQLMFYAETKFETTVSKWNMAHLILWLETMEKRNRKKITYLVITCKDKLPNLSFAHGGKDCPWCVLLAEIKRYGLTAPVVSWKARISGKAPFWYGSAMDCFEGLLMAEQFAQSLNLMTKFGSCDNSHELAKLEEERAQHLQRLGWLAKG